MSWLPPGLLRCISAPSLLRQSKALRNRHAGLLFQVDAGPPKQRYNFFLNKRLCVDASAQISKKSQIQALLLTFRSGTLCVVVFITHTYITVVWLSDYVINAGTPQACDGSFWQYCAIMNSKHNVWGLPDSGAKTQPTHICWNFGVTFRQIDFLHMVRVWQETGWERGSDTQQRTPGWDSNPELLQQGQSLCTWDAYSTNWAKLHPVKPHCLNTCQIYPFSTHSYTAEAAM